MSEHQPNQTKETSTQTKKTPAPRVAENKGIGAVDKLIPSGIQNVIERSAAQDVSSQVAMLKRLRPAQQQSLLRNISSTQGNGHVQRLIKAYAANSRPPTATEATGGGLTLQAKLTVNPPNDKHEQEADAVAAAVTQTAAMPTPPSEASEIEGGPSLLQAKFDGVTPAGSNVETRIEQMRGGGQPLPTEEQNFFEGRMDADFSKVRVHTDQTAVQTSRDLNARAFTVGTNIAFNAGEYTPGTTAGRTLLAHELTHVVQQGGAGKLSPDSSVMCKREGGDVSALVENSETLPSQDYQVQLKPSAPGAGVKAGPGGDMAGVVAGAASPGGILDTLKDFKQIFNDLSPRIGDTATIIKKDPPKFGFNLFKSVGQGVKGYKDNIHSFLQEGLIRWLTGAMAKHGISLPKKFDAPGIFQLVLQLLGLGMSELRQLINKHLGVDLFGMWDNVSELADVFQKEGMAGLGRRGLGQALGGERATAMLDIAGAMKATMTGDFGELWKLLQGYLTNLQETVIGQIKDLVISSIITPGITFLLSMLVPGGGIFKALMGVYNFVKTLIDNRNQIEEVTDGVIDAIPPTARGDIDPAANKIKNSLGGATPVLISFLAAWLGLQGLHKRVIEIAQTFGERVKKALEAMLKSPPAQMVARFFKRIKDKAVAGLTKTRDRLLGKQDRFAGAGDGQIIGKAAPFTAKGEQHKVWLEIEGKQPTFMMASKKTEVKKQLEDWENRIPTLDSEDKKKQAREAIDKARKYIVLDEYGPEAGWTTKFINKLEEKKISLAKLLIPLFELFGESKNAHNLEGLIRELPESEDALLKAIGEASIYERHAVLENPDLVGEITKRASSKSSAVVIFTALLEDFLHRPNKALPDVTNKFQHSDPKWTGYTDFGRWIAGGEEKKYKPTYSSGMDSIEGIFFAAYLAGAVDYQWLLTLYKKAAETGNKSFQKEMYKQVEFWVTKFKFDPGLAATVAETFYCQGEELIDNDKLLLEASMRAYKLYKDVLKKALKLDKAKEFDTKHSCPIARGNLVFFGGLDLVALSLGTMDEDGSPEVMALWERGGMGGSVIGGFARATVHALKDRNGVRNVTYAPPPWS